jgi:Transposase IS116/IS110/IS902 family.
MDEIKSVFDDRVQTMRLKNKINNQLLAYQRRVDTVNSETEAFLKESLKPVETRLARIDSRLKTLVAGFSEVDSLTKTALAVPGVGEITIAALLVYIDLEKAATPSALWKYAGLHCASGERYTKGEAGGGNKTLRTVLWTSADSLMKGKNGYRAIYDRVKTRLAASQKLVKSRNTEGKLVEVQWGEAKPSHRHGAALRAIMKQLLADYWLIGRELAGLPVTTPYVEGVLGHKDISPPAERGWMI